MVDDGGSHGQGDAAAGAAIGVAARRGLLGGGRGGSTALGAGLGRVGAHRSGGSGLLTTIIVVGLLVGTLAVMFFAHAK